MGTSATSAAASATRRAILLVLLASALFTLSSAIIKWVGPEIPAVEMVAIRCVFALVPLLPLFARHGWWRAFITPHWRLNVERTLYGFFGMITSIHGYVVLPLVLVTALGFVMPLFLVALSVPLLGERVGWRRTTAVLVGFAGVLVMVRPWLALSGEEPLPLASVAFVIAGVATWALAMIAIRRMGRLGEQSVTITAWFTVGSALLAGLLSIPVWVTPSWEQFAALAAIGLISGLAQVLMTEGYRTGETTLLAPFEYLSIVYATALGFAFWSEVPDVWETLGVGVIVASGLYVWHRETVLGLRR
jgi:drug/metabolite transporter (DMT)-like permease